jgi:four helix bundle protein
VIDGWKVGRLDGWKIGWLEGWKTGGLDGWKIGRMAEELVQVPDIPISHSLKGNQHMTQTHVKLQPEGLRELRAYQLAKKLAHLVYEATSSFPKSEYRLVGQMRGSAISVYGNIAEGYGRNALGDYVRFCEIARGSLAELGSYLEFCQERGMLQPTQTRQLLEAYNHTWNTLGALLRSLKGKQLDGSWDRTYQAAKEDQEPYDA